MSRRATVSIRVDDGLVLRPAGPSVLTELQEAFEETLPEVSRAMPWIDMERDLRQQILSFLDETQRMGRSGLLHHWVMTDPRSEQIMGLIGFDRVTRSTKSDWNLGYWVRSLNQKYGVAKRSIRAVLEWLGRGNKIVVELKVDPHNLPGLSTVKHAVREWGGTREPDGDSASTVAGLRTMHHCYLIEIGDRGSPDMSYRQVRG